MNEQILLVGRLFQFCLLDPDEMGCFTGGVVDFSVKVWNTKTQTRQHQFSALSRWSPGDNNLPLISRIIWYNNIHICIVIYVAGQQGLSVIVQYEVTIQY